MISARAFSRLGARPRLTSATSSRSLFAAMLQYLYVMLDRPETSMPAEVDATLLHAPGQCPRSDQQAGKMYPLLIVRRELNNLFITFQKIGKHSGGECLSVVHLEVPQVVEGVAASDLAEVDDACVATVFLVNVRRVEIAVRKPRLLDVQPGPETIDNPPDCLDLSRAQNAFT